MAQYLRPSSDITIGVWTPTPLYQQIDEITPNDGDSINAGKNATGATFEVLLTSGNDPNLNTGHIIRIRVSDDKNNATSDVYLYQGTTLIATIPTVSHTTTYTTHTYTLTGTEADSITDYTNLRLRVVSNSTAAGTPYVSWAEFEIPDPPPNNALTSQEITTGTPTLEQSSLSQNNVLASQGINSGTPVLDQSSISQVHSLSSQEFISNIALEQSDIEINYNLVSQDIVEQAPTIDTPEAEGFAELVGQEVISQGLFEEPALSQIHILGSQELSSGTFLEQSNIEVNHNLSSQSIIVSSVVDSPEAEGFAELAGLEILSQAIVELPLFTQEYALVSENISSTAIIEKPVGSLFTQDINIQPRIDNPSISQNHALEGDSIVSESTIETMITYNPEEVMVTPDLVSRIEVGAPIIFAQTESGQTPTIEEEDTGGMIFVSGDGAEDSSGGSVALLDGAVIGRAALGQNDIGFSSPSFIDTPYVIVSVPDGFETEIKISINPGAMGQQIEWGVDEQSGCGTAYFGPYPEAWGEITTDEFTNVLHFTPSSTWQPPYRTNIYVTDGHLTIRTSVFIYFAGALTMPAEVSMDDYEIFLADREFNLAAQIDNFIEATFVVKYNDVGTFSISMDIEDVTDFEGKVLSGWGKPEADPKKQTYGNILLTRNSVPLFWGVVKEFEREWDVDKNLLIMKGEDTMTHLKARLALPKPNRSTTVEEGLTIPVYSSNIYHVIPYPTIGAVSYNGSLNSASDIYNVAGAGASVSNAQRTYRIWIVEEGSNGGPDKFAWKEISTGNADVEGTKITGKAQSIDNAVVSIEFKATTGHKVGSYSSNYWTFTFRQSNMNAEEVIKQFVRKNIGSEALLFRQVSGLEIEPLHAPVLGNLARGRARFDNLLELIQNIALPNLREPKDNRKPIHFYMDGLTFRTREVADLSDSVVLSKDLDTIRRFKYNAKASTGNYLYVGGKGDEGERDFVEWANDEGSIPQYGLIERFVDANGGETITDLYATAIEELVKTQDNTVLELEPIDKPFMTIIDDYWVGDKVTAIVDGSEFQEIIREATIKINASEGATIIPVLGTPDTRRKELLTLFRTVRKIDSRLSGFERR